MKAVKFDECNFTFKAGNNPNTEDLQVCKAIAPHLSEGKPANFILTKWQLTDEDVENILLNRCIHVAIMGNGMPPILPFTEHPFEEMMFRPVDKLEQVGELIDKPFPKQFSALLNKEIEMEREGKKTKGIVVDIRWVPGFLGVQLKVLDLQGKEYWTPVFNVVEG